ncbi:MAG: tetratricopeptide repeat protein [Anaerolineae bacterium]|nr:tetratricopeptide repeat protein [Anaerolineae bacterium]MCA9888692.1 tetratricopeptide repeat protein [Anaerolineae bacterium]MCA9892818.1 tetratricopeptide repeat protein [Anaerolineae bacterium]MCB9461609.1 tetratricopeptide repeat protein [Anaerolineaceae bacterium]
MSTMPTEERIGQAWRLHRSGDYAAAIDMFDEILRKTPNNIDALYGIGLAQQGNGNTGSAVEAFQKALELATASLKAVEVTSVVDGHHGANDLDTYEDDRYLLLQRMIKQRLTELGAQPSAKATIEE